MSIQKVSHILMVRAGLPCSMKHGTCRHQNAVGKDACEDAVEKGHDPGGDELCVVFGAPEGAADDGRAFLWEGEALYVGGVFRRLCFCDKFRVLDPVGADSGDVDAPGGNLGAKGTGVAEKEGF